MRPGRGRQQYGMQYGVYLLCVQALNFGFDKIPPGTLLTIIGQVSNISFNCYANKVNKIIQLLSSNEI